MIRWIHARLGTAPYAADLHDAGTVIDVRHLVDKAGNDPNAIRMVVDRGVELLESGHVVLVACDFGISRSNAIAAGILSRTDRLPFHAALATVVRATGETEIKLEMSASVRTALESERHEAGTATLLTGSSGFFGRAVRARLGESANVFAPSRTELDLESGATSLAAYCSEHHIGQIVHLAYPRRYTDASSSAANLTTTLALIDVCRQAKIRLVYVSGSVVFSGYAAVHLEAEETLPMFPRGRYGEAKYVDELLIELAHRRGEIDRLILRFSPLYGPGCERPRILRTFFEKARKGDPILTHVYRNGEPALDLLHVEDAAEGLVRALSLPGSEILHFGTGRLLTTREIAQSILAVTASSSPLSTLAIDDDTSNVAFPANRAYETLGWRSQRVFEEALPAVLDAFSRTP